MVLNKEQKGVWIALEGLDGAGKSALSEMLKAYFEKLGIPAIKTHEPGGNHLSDKIRDLIFNPEIKDDPISQLCLFAAARRANIRKTVLPAWKKGEIVISDRSEGSSFVYQHFQYGLSLETIRSINDAATEGVKPTLTFLLDVGYEVGQNRVRQSKGADFNYFDHPTLEVWTKRRDGYFDLAHNPEKYGMNPWIVIDANLSIDKVRDQAIEVMHQQGVIK